MTDDVSVFPSQLLTVEALRRPVESTRAALVGMVKQAGARTATYERHLERPDDEVPIADGAHRPAHHESREQIEDGGQIELAPALPDEDLRRIADPPLIRGVG